MTATSTSPSVAAAAQYYFSGLVLQISEGRPVAATTRPLGVELLRLPAVRQLAVAAKSRRQLQANVWLSSSHTSTPLHYDTSDNLFVQVHGCKRVKLLPPRAALSLPLEPLHSPGHRQLSDDIIGGERVVGGRTINSTINSTINTINSEGGWRVVQLQAGDALWLPAYRLSLSALIQAAVFCVFLTHCEMIEIYHTGQNISDTRSCCICFPTVQVLAAFCRNITLRQQAGWSPG